MRLALVGAVIALVLPGCREAEEAPDEDWATLVESEARGMMLSVWGRSAEEVYVVGGRSGEAAIGQWDGDELRWLDNPGESPAWWVTGAGERTFVVGEAGLGLIRDGQGEWQRWDTGVTSTLFGAWARGPSDVWIVGGDFLGGGPPVLRRWDGTRWWDAELPELEEVPDAFFKVWGDGDMVYVSGDRGVMLRYDGRNWTQLMAPRPDAMLTVHGREGEIWSAGGRAQGALWRLEGEAWIDETPAGLPGLAGVHQGAEALLVSGARGLLMERLPGRDFRRVPSLTTDLLHSVWEAPDGSAWAVGGDFFAHPEGTGVILRRAGQARPGEPRRSPNRPDDETPSPDAAEPEVIDDAGLPPPEPVDLPEPELGPRCAPGWLRGEGTHRLYLQGREATPDARGVYPLLESREAIVHGEHYLLGTGAYAEWSIRLCADLDDQILFYLPNNDDVGSEALHELFVVREGVEQLIASAIDTQAGEQGYNPFVARPRALDVLARAGDELLLRTTNLNEVMFSVMIWRPPSEYMSYVEVQLVEDGPAVSAVPAEEPPARPCDEAMLIGRGLEAFDPMADGEVQLEVGPQGSFMVSLALQTSGLEPGEVALELWAELGDRPLGNLRRRVGMSPGAEGLEASGLVLTINPDLRAGELLGQSVTVRGAVSDASGRRACGERQITLVR